jgi:hypothetical protein
VGSSVVKYQNKLKVISGYVYSSVLLHISSLPIKYSWKCCYREEAEVLCMHIFTFHSADNSSLNYFYEVYVVEEQITFSLKVKCLSK